MGQLHNIAVAFTHTECYERLGNIDKNKIQAELQGDRRPTAGAAFARLVIQLARLDPGKEVRNERSQDR